MTRQQQLKTIIGSLNCVIRLCDARAELLVKDLNKTLNERQVVIDELDATVREAIFELMPV